MILSKSKHKPAAIDVHMFISLVNNKNSCGDHHSESHRAH